MISVCMATYNGEKYIREQVNSILSQLGPEDELVVSDDGSKDRTVDILLAYQDNRIRVYNHSFNGIKQCVGDVVSANFENALKHAKGDYVFLSDQDDIWVPGKVEKMKALLDTHAVVVSNAWLMMTKEPTECRETLYTERTPLHNYFFRRGKYYGCCMALRGDTLRYVLPFPQPLPMHDAWLGLLPEIVEGAYFLNEPLIFYRRHAGNVSGVSKNSLFFKFYYRVRLLTLIVSRALRVKFSKH